MTAEVSDEILGKLSRQWAEVFDRVRRGVLDPRDVTLGVQGILEKHYPPKFNPPLWYTSQGEQLNRLRQLNRTLNWGFTEADFPQSIPPFVPRTPTEVPLLAAYRPSGLVSSVQEATFWSYWTATRLAYDPEEDSECWQMRGNLRRSFVANKGGWVPLDDYRPGIRWVGFDPNTYHGFSPEAARSLAARDGRVLAGPEVLMALVMFNTWPLMWDGGVWPCPVLSGMSLSTESGIQDKVPGFDRVDEDRVLKMCLLDVTNAEPSGASPTIREL